jgi:hypothetical protein
LDEESVFVEGEQLVWGDDVAEEGSLDRADRLDVNADRPVLGQGHDDAVTGVSYRGM